MNQLTIIIPVLNDQDEANLTIKSIRETAGYDVDILVIDDASNPPLTVSDTKTRLIRHDKRIGAGATKHEGVVKAETEYCLLLDSHCRFEPGWLTKALERIVGRYDTIHCGVCLGLDQDNMDVTKYKGEYYGANLSVYDPTINEIFEGKWAPKREDDDYDIACLMGACYFVYKPHFIKLRGMAGLKMWGSEEPYISVKTWLSGGSIKLIKGVRIGHKFRSVAPYVTEVPPIIYNKLRAIKTVFSPKLSSFLISKFTVSNDLNRAVEMLADESPVIKEHIQYYRSIFTRTEDWYFKKFNIQIPTFNS